ncbi:hypothetical protein DIPPA_34796 [Diplonema papillatum]|nr:hypothetical protein DIPPA_34796 [Diplonema papillatum]|eukprot:gene21330-32797_t
MPLSKAQRTAQRRNGDEHVLRGARTAGSRDQPWTIIGPEVTRVDYERVVAEAKAREEAKTTAAVTERLHGALLAGLSGVCEEEREALAARVRRTASKLAEHISKRHKRGSKEYLSCLRTLQANLPRWPETEALVRGTCPLPISHVAVGGPQVFSRTDRSERQAQAAADITVDSKYPPPDSLCDACGLTQQMASTKGHVLSWKGKDDKDTCNCTVATPAALPKGVEKPAKPAKADVSLVVVTDALF